MVIIEDELLCRETVRQVCRDQLGYEIVGETGDGIEAVRLVRETVPDLVLLDLNLPGDSGFGVADKIAESHPQIGLIFMSAHCDAVSMHRVEKARARGFIDKNTSSFAIFKQALGEAAAGRKFFSPSYHEAVRHRQHDHHSFDKVLTLREQQVLRLIGLSQTNEEIAAKLGLSVQTIATHRKRILKKLELGSTPKLIKYAAEKGFTQHVS